jgi:hypothetical protein
VGKKLTKIEGADSAVAGRAAAQAPAAGRLAAAMATIWASRRPIRDGAARRNEVTCRISHFPFGPGTAEHTRKMGVGG